MKEPAGGDQPVGPSDAQRRRRLDLLAQLTLVALAAALLGRALFSTRVFYYRDVAGYWYPLIETFVRTVVGGEWPLWNPHLGFGYPMLEDPNLQLAYPPTWLNLLLPPALYYKVFVVAHLAWGAVGAHRLGRRLGLGTGAAFVGAAIFLCSGPWLSAITLWHHFAGLAWLPWVWLAVERMLARPCRESGVVLGCVAAAQALAGSADLCVMAGLAAAVRMGGSRALRAAPLPVVRAGAVALGLAGLIGAAQWLPTLGIIQVGVRSGLGAESSAYWSLHPIRLIELVLPRVIVDLPLGPAARELLLESREAFLRSIYLGAPAVALAALALIRRPSRLLAVAFLAFVGVALGRYTPVYDLLLLLPPIAMLRFPIKFLWPAALLWGLLAGFGYQAALRRWSPELRRGATLVGFAFCGGGLLLLLGEGIGLSAAKIPELLDPELSPALRSAAVQRAGRTVAQGGVLLLLAGLLVGWRSRRELPGPVFPWLLAVVVVGDVAVAGWSTYRLAPAELLEHRPPLIDEMASRAGRPRVYSRKEPRDRLMESLRQGSGHAASGLSWLLGDLERLRAPAAARWAVDGSYQGDFTGLAPQVAGQMDMLVTRAWGRPLGRRLLAIGSVTHAVALRDWGPGAPPRVASLQSVFSEPIRVFELEMPLPRAYAVSGVRVAAEPGSFDLLQLPDFDPRAEVILGPPAQGRSVTAEFEARTELSWRAATSVGIRAELSGPGYVVLTDSYWPGWQATVDGAPAPIHRANVLFRAVRVGAGRHDIEFRYAPRLVPWGVAGSLLGVALARLMGPPWRRRLKGQASGD